MPGRSVNSSWSSTAQKTESDTGPSRDCSTLVTSLEVEGRAGGVGGVPGDIRLARLILLTVLSGFLAVQLIDVLTSPIPSHGAAVGVSLICVVVVFTLQVFISSAGASRWPTWRRAVLLVAQGMVTYLPLMVLGQTWGGMAGFFAGSVLLLVPGWAAWALFTAVTASMLAAGELWGLTPYGVAYVTVATLDIGLVVFGLSRLSQVVRYAHATRAQLAQLAVIGERMRFARDLHDLLGYSLSAITLKAELTRRLVASDPDQARDELAEVLDIARQALSDVRLVARGYRNISLAQEGSSVTSLLSTAGIHARVEITCGALDEKVDTVLATVLREAVTNMLRHSAAQTCTIEADQVGEIIRLRVVNDGVLPSEASGSHCGGLQNLAERLQRIDGRLTAGTLPDGRFEVLAEAPAGPVKNRERVVAVPLERDDA
jgi:two-component system, NarL family, sensor histidine kinase DesK